MTDYYREKLEEGNKFQDYVVERMLRMHGRPICQFASKHFQQKTGESANAYEVKFDGKLSSTGNLYVETEEKSAASNENYVPSGIFRDDNTVTWLIGDKRGCYEFAKTFLRSLYELREKKKFRLVETPTSRGFLIPEEWARKWATYWTFGECK